MSDKYAIKASTLTALGDAVRSKTLGMSELPKIISNSLMNYNTIIAIEFKEPFVKSMKIKGTIQNGTPGGVKYNSSNRLAIVPGIYEYGYQARSVMTEEDKVPQISDEYMEIYEFEMFKECNIATLFCQLNDANVRSIYVEYEVIGYGENGEEYKYTPLEMVDKINGLSVIPEEGLNITGNCQYRFYNGNYDWFIKSGGDKITTTDITDSTYMFQISKVEEIPFDINMKLGEEISMDYLFSEMENLKTVPKVLNAKPQTMQYLLSGCRKLEEIPEDWCDTWDWSYMKNLTSSTNGKASHLFYGCYSLRKVPHCLFQGLNPASRYSDSIYYFGFGYCSVLDEIINLPMPYNTSWTSNGFNGFANNCCRLKNITFALQEDGTPYVMKWKGSTIDLSQYTGYASSSSTIIGKAGITADKQVKDDATYQALKDNPDWWTTNLDYCRYNHDSAVATINSLPDCSATGTNTIKFKGKAGALTDGGAINTLTEEEIAVAAAKGWTVSLV